MTKREMFNHIATVNAEDAEIVAFCEHEVELLNNRKSGSKSPTKTQKENEGIKAIVLDVLGDMTEPVTVTTLLGDDRLSGYTNQKISSMLRQLRESKEVVRTIEKKKSFFSLA